MQRLRNFFNLFFACQFWLLFFCVVDMLRPARSTSSFEVGLWRFSFLCAFSRALKRRKKIGAAPAGVVDAFLKELEIIELPGKQLAGSLTREGRRRSCRVHVQYLGCSEEVAESCRSMRFSEEVWPEETESTAPSWDCTSRGSRRIRVWAARQRVLSGKLGNRRSLRLD